MSKKTGKEPVETMAVSWYTMDKGIGNCTDFSIAHRLSAIQDADLIPVMKDGDIVESGDHKTLLAQNGFCSERYNSRFHKTS